MKNLKFKVIKANDKTLFYKYNVQVYTRPGVGEHFYYCGIGRFCNTIIEVLDYKKRIKEEYRKGRRQ